MKQYYVGIGQDEVAQAKLKALANRLGVVEHFEAENE